MRLHARGGGVGGCSRPGIAGARQRDLGDTQLLRLRDGGRHAPRFEASGRVLALVLDAQPPATKAEPS